MGNTMCFITKCVFQHKIIRSGSFIDEERFSFENENMVKFLKLLESVLYSQGESAKYSWCPVLCRSVNPAQERFISSVSSGLRSSPQDAKHLSLHLPLPPSSFPPSATVYPMVCPGFMYLGIGVLVEKAGESALKHCSFSPMQILIFNFLYHHAVEWVLHRSTWQAKRGQAEESWIGPSTCMLVSMTTTPFCALRNCWSYPPSPESPLLGVWGGQRAVVHVLKTHCMSRRWYTGEMLQRKIHIVPSALWHQWQRTYILEGDTLKLFGLVEGGRGWKEMIFKVLSNPNQVWF